MEEQRSLAEFSAAELKTRREQLNIALSDLSIQQTLLEAEQQKIDLEEYKRAIASQTASSTTEVA